MSFDKALARAARLFLLGAVLAVPGVRAGELTLGVGVFTFAPDGVDLQAGYRADNSPWLFGFRYVRWTDTFEDPFTGRELTDTTETKTGPLVYYLFRPQGTWSPYVGLSVLNWTSKEKLLRTGETSTDSTTTPYFGGGIMGRIGSSVFHYNAGIFLSPWAKLHTQTAESSEDSSGGFDIQLQLGIVF